jgi:hypothetical protein
MRRFIRSAATAFLLFTTSAGAGAVGDPPGRVGRLSLVEGDVTFHDTAAQETAPATLNWPMTGGAAISTAPDARAEVRIGSTAIRLDGATALEFVRVDDQSIHLRLEYGAVAVRVRNREVASEIVLETRDARVGFSDAGRYRIEAGRAPDTTAITAFQGAARVDAGGIAFAVQPGRRAEVGGGFSARVFAARADAFDDWTLALDQRDDAVREAPRYVSPETTGYESLDQYGDWRQTPDYGPVWMPRAVPADWAPYRAGRWAWVEPWGWTWIDEAPWGFAPFHYGRWALVGGAWGWVPGAVVARPVYAPALVGWVGRPGWGVTVSIGGAAGVGWFPLAPREVFVPGYRCSTVYVRNVNVTHVTNVVNITNVPPRHYEHRHHDRAVTVVPAAAVAGGQPVGRWAQRMRQADVVADTGVSNAPPASAIQPPRQFGDRRRDDDRRWTRGAQPAPGGVPQQQTASTPATAAPQQQSPSRPIQRERDPERRRDVADGRPEPQRPAPAQAAPAAVPFVPPTGEVIRPAAPIQTPAPPPVAQPQPAPRPDGHRGEPRDARQSERRDGPRPQTLPPAPAAPAASGPLIPPSGQVIRPPAPIQTPVPQGRAATAPQPIVQPQPVPRPDGDRGQPREARQGERRAEPRPHFAPPAPAASGPLIPPSGQVIRPPAPIQTPVPQVRAPAAPQPMAQPQPAPRPDGNRGHPRETRQGERRG